MFLDVRDEWSGQLAPWGRMQFERPRISVRDLIQERVRLELERQAGWRKADPWTVSLTSDEKRLNAAPPATPIGALLTDTPHQDRTAGTRQGAFAEEAFVKGRYFVLLDDRQAESLDESIDLARTSEVTFLLLTPLQGG